MSEVVHQARALSAEELAERFRDVASYRAAERRLRFDYARLAYGVAGILAVLLAGSVSENLWLVSHRPLPEPPRYIEVHEETGYVGPPVTARDAPRLFSERVERRYLRDYVTACLSYVPDTYAMAVHQCALMSAPERQRRLATEISERNPDAPVKLYGPHGYAMPQHFTFERRGVGKFQTIAYVVRFQLYERANGQETARWFTASVDFQWHPELAMQPDDATLNEAGMQVVSFAPSPDPGQRTLTP